MSSNEVGSKNMIELDYPQPSDYLNDDEKRFLEKTNILANAIQGEQRQKQDFFSLSLHDLLSNWSNNTQGILIDLTNELDIQQALKNTDNFYEFIVSISKQIWQICTKNYRIIYFGMTLVFISIMLYFIMVSG